MKSLDVIISTCNNRILNLSDMNLKPYLNVRYLIIQQIFEKALNTQRLEAFKAQFSARTDIKFYLCYERGLSKSRNFGISQSTADICLLGDDDITYLDGALPKIIEAFNQHCTEDVIAFKMLTSTGQPVRRYPETLGGC